LLLEGAVRQSQDNAKRILGDETFEGDAHSLLVLIYKDNSLPLEKGPREPSVEDYKLWRLMSAFGGKADIGWCSANVRYWPKADIPSCTAHVRFRG